MAISLRIPWLVDLIVSSDPAEIRMLNEHPDVTRAAVRSDHALNRVMARRLDPGLRFGGRLLPVAMDPRGRTEDPPVRTAPAPPEAALVDALARYVGGASIARPIGVVAQELVARMRIPSYHATPRTYADAQLVVRALTPLLPMTRWRALRRDAAKQRLDLAARGDLDCIHATTIAVHNVVHSLEAMRRLARSARDRELRAETVLDRCIAAPERLVRFSARPGSALNGRHRLRVGTWILLRTRRADTRTRSSVSAFGEGQWSVCPDRDPMRSLLAEVWTRRREVAPVPPLRLPLLERILEWATPALERHLAWHAWGKLGVLVLIGRRARLRRRSLHAAPATELPAILPADPTDLRLRRSDGAHNDLELPAMGAAGTPFGRNIAPELLGAQPHAAEPNARLISEQLLGRRTFEPIPHLNLLTTAWLQLMLHDWLDHGHDAARRLAIPAPDGTDDGMWIPATLEARRLGSTRGRVPIFVNTETHWWDASQIYGSSAAITASLREPGSARLSMPRGRLPRTGAGSREASGFTKNWWLGLSVLHTLFALEHNAICERLERDHPSMTAEERFGTARLVNAALMAKIHTLEWTPAILDHPALDLTMRGTWWGVLGETVRKTFGRVSDSALLSGVLGAERTHHGVPYSMTEEFAAVYRMHPLLPDEIVLRSYADDSDRATERIEATVGPGAPALIDAHGMANSLYSFGRAHPGALVLWNYPQALRQLTTEDGLLVDLGAVDITRDRERRIPRYNAFRHALGLPRARTIEDLCARREWVEPMTRIYKNDVDSVDLQVGMLAEPRPPGFGFGETAFRIFTFMTVRRLESDRFFTTDFRPEIYTRAGMDWIADNDLRSVIQRHFPELGAATRGTRSAFAPWRPASAGAARAASDDSTPERTTS